MANSRRKRVVATFPSRAGETISIVPNRRGYEKLNDVRGSRQSQRRPLRPSKNLGKCLATRGKEPVCETTTGPQPWSEPRALVSNRAAVRRRSRVKIIVKKVRDTVRRFKESARVANQQLGDLFPANHMVLHVTAMPVIRTKTMGRHSPSPGLWRYPATEASLSRSFRK